MASKFTANEKAVENKHENEGRESSSASAFHELLSKGRNAFSKSDIKTAELHYSAALKLVYQAAKKEEMRICFEELGNIYLEHGKKNKSGEDFAKATALYNSALTRLTNNQAKLQQHLISCIKETERHFLNSILQEDSPIDIPNYDNDMKHKALLETIRDDCKEVILQVDLECDPGLMPLNPEERVALEQRRTNLISTLFRKISEDMTNFIRMLIEECMVVLGNAPCRFAVIGLGSLARNEMTPYSDLEFAILVEEGAKTESNLAYFRNITRYLHLKVLNLGETILPSMNIASLNDFYSGDPSRMWFFDDGPKGFSFDGAMPWASKFPFGRKKSQTKEALELIKTPDEMAALQSEQVAIKEGYHLADVLATSMFITGDEELLTVYRGKVKEKLQAPLGDDMWTNGSKRGFECLKETVRDFSFNLDWCEAGKVFNVKKELYRFPSLVLNSLTLYYNLDTRNTWDVVQEMQKKQRITEDEAHNLSFVLAVASELRLRSYLGKDEQRERMTGLPSEMMEPDLARSIDAKAGPNASMLDKVFHIRNPDIVFRFFMTVLPLQEAIAEFLFKMLPEEVNILSNHSLYDDRSETKAIIHIRLLEFEKAKCCLESVVCQVEDVLESGKLAKTPCLFETFSNLGNVCLQLGEVEQAVDYFEKAAQVLEVIYNDDKATLEFARSCRDRGNACFALGEYKKSLSFYEESLSIKMLVGGRSPAFDTAVYFNQIASAYQEMGDLKKAVVFYERSLEIVKEVDKTRVSSNHCIALNNLLAAYATLGDIQKALDTYKELFETLTTLFGAGVLHPYLVSSLNNLGNAHSRVGKYEQAALFYEQSLYIRQRLCGRSEVHPLIATLLHNLGRCHSRLSDYGRAVKYFREALEMWKFLYGKQVSHPDIANTLNSLGSALLHQEDVSGALEMYDEALQLFRVIHKDNFAHRDLCVVLNNLGIVHIELNDFKKAAAYLEEAHKHWLEICVNDKPDEDFASCLNNLGNAYRDLGHYKEAYECCRKGLEMRKTLRSEGKDYFNNSRLLAKSFIETGHCCVSLGDSENALSYYQRALEIRKEMNFEVAAAHTEVARGYSSLGRPLEAIKCYEEVIRLDEKKYGAGNVPDSTHSTNLCNLGGQYIATEEYEKAAEMLEKALKILKRMPERGASVMLLASTLNNLGIVYRNLEDSEKALSYLEEALAVKKQLYGKDRAHLEIAKTLTNLGNLCSQLGRFQKAIDYFLESLDMKYALYGANAIHQSIAATLGNIGNLYYQMGQYESAVAYLKQALQRFGEVESCNRQVALNLYNLGEAYLSLADLPAACGCYEKSLRIMVQVFGESHALVKRVLQRLLSIRGLAQLEASQVNVSG